MLTFKKLTSIVGSFVLAVSSAGVPAQEPETVTVKIGGIVTLTGPAAAWHLVVGRSKIVYFDHLNKSGGIPFTGPDGKKKKLMIDYRYEDVGYDAKKVAVAFNRLRDWGASAIIADGSLPVAALVAPAARDRVPVMESNGVHPDPVEYLRDLKAQWVLPTSPLNTDASQSLLYLYKKNVWNKKHPSETRPMKVGIISLDGPQRRFYKDKRVKDDYAKIGVDLVEAVMTPMALTDASIELRRMRDAGVEVIIVDHVISAAKVVLEDAERLGMRDKVDYILWYLELKQMLEDKKLFRGVYNGWIPPQYYSDDRMPKMNEAAKKYLAADQEYWKDRLDGAMVTEHLASFMVASLKGILEERGTEGLTREAIRAKLFGKTVVDSGVYPKYTIDPNWPMTMYYAFMYRLDVDKERYDHVGKPVAPGPSIFTPAWNPADDPSVVETKYYQ